MQEILVTGKRNFYNCNIHVAPRSLMTQRFRSDIPLLNEHRSSTDQIPRTTPPSTVTQVPVI
jgi:hypothetical protein